MISGSSNVAVVAVNATWDWEIDSTDLCKTFELLHWRTYSVVVSLILID